MIGTAGIRIRKIDRESALEYWGVLWVIIFSGSLYFQILRIKLTMIIVGLTILVFLYLYKKVKRNNFMLSLTIATIAILNSFINIRNDFDINEYILLLTKLAFACVLVSHLSFETYKRKYVIIMTIEALISIICYLYADVFAIGKLPLQQYMAIEANGYYMTPYYTVGWEISPLLHRNSGMFSEPGAHQIFLNFALLFLLSDHKRLGLTKRNYRISLVLLVTAVLTTQSTTGYMCLVVVLASTLFINAKKNRDMQGKKNLLYLRILTLFALAILWIVENNLHIVEYKLTGGGSFGTRTHETSTGYSLALLNPIIGQGIFQAKVVLAQNDILYMSNGLASFLIGSGLILGGVFLCYMYLRMNKLLPYGLVFSILAFGFYLLCVNASSGVLNPVYLVFLFFWKDE